jgi:D-alanyl-D-alanine carboxypeptidase/D-alanyl-D-alanine-endopeptidase (penicillin-binding protein 4)
VKSLTLCLLALAVASEAAAQDVSLAAVVEQQLARPSLQHALAGIDIEDDEGHVLYQRNAHTLLIPASNRKLFAAATAVTCLGFDARTTTELWRDGRDLVLRGGGDPSLGGRYAFNRDAVFAPFVAALRTRGIGSVEGDLIADVSLYDRVTIPGSWKAGNLGTDYAAPVDALAYNENVAGIAADDCGRGVVSTDPWFVVAHAAITCGATGDEPESHSDANNVITLTGAMAPHGTTLAAVADPALYALQALRDALRHAGIDVRGALRVSTQPRAWEERLAVIDAPPLSSLLPVMLKNSQNLYAEMVFKNAGGGTYAGAFARERAFVREAGIDPDEVHFADGSGLSPDDLVTPAAMVKLLRWMNEPARRGMWWTLLAQPGGEGTLRKRLIPLAARLRGKTGSVAGVNALSVIIAGSHGGWRYATIILNHHTASTAEALGAIDAIVTAAAEF